MKYSTWASGLALAVGLSAVIATSPADAFEYGFIGVQQPNGLTHGIVAADPPPGLYMFDEPVLFEGHLVGPGSPRVNGYNPSANVTGVAIGLLYTPGWQILGGTYSAALFQPIYSETLGNPINFTTLGIHNTLIEPLGISWKLGESGLFVKLELGAYVPDGTIRGPAGLSSVGTPWTTFQPTLSASYLANGLDLTARLFEEINTTNYKTGYRSGSIFHAELTATKKFGKFKIGPVANYAGQITDDKSSAYYGNLIQNNRLDLVGVGGMVGYDFGPVNLEVWATDFVLAKASQGTISAGANAPVAPNVAQVFARLSYRIGGDAPPPPTPVQARY